MGGELCSCKARAWRDTKFRPFCNKTRPDQTRPARPSPWMTSKAHLFGPERHGGGLLGLLNDVGQVDAHRREDARIPA